MKPPTTSACRMVSSVPVSASTPPSRSTTATDVPVEVSIARSMGSSLLGGREGASRPARAVAAHLEHARLLGAEELGVRGIRRPVDRRTLGALDDDLEPGVARRRRGARRPTRPRPPTGRSPGRGRRAGPRCRAGTRRRARAAVRLRGSGGCARARRWGSARAPARRGPRRCRGSAWSCPAPSGPVSSTRSPARSRAARLRPNASIASVSGASTRIRRRPVPNGPRGRAPPT